MAALLQKIVLPIKRFFSIPNSSSRWFWDSVLFPFLITRSIWELVAYFVYGNYVSNPSYPRYIERGYFLTRIFPLDIFARWDSSWYFSIIRDGYQPSADLTQSYSNMAFFPLYPYLVKSLGWFGLDLPNAYYVLVGLALSNLMFIAAMALLYRLTIVDLGFSEETARRALGLLFVFPVSFYLSSFYPESLFLFLVLAGFTAAMEDKWFLAGICSALVVLTKPTGVVAVFALGWLYMEKRRWMLSQIRVSAAWLALAPLALLSHFYFLYLQSGHGLAFLDAMQAWGGLQPALLLEPLKNVSGASLNVFKIDLILTIFFWIASLYLLWKWRIKALGVYAILMISLAFSTGLLVSISRYLLVCFPVFVLLGERIRSRNAYDALRAAWFALQIIYFSGWVNYYWIA